jgi:hypothetical protein
MGSSRCWSLGVENACSARERLWMRSTLDFYPLTAFKSGWRGPAIPAEDAAVLAFEQGGRTPHGQHIAPERSSPRPDDRFMVILARTRALRPRLGAILPRTIRRLDAFAGYPRARPQERARREAAEQDRLDSNFSPEGQMRVARPPARGPAGLTAREAHPSQRVRRMGSGAFTRNG